MTADGCFTPGLANSELVLVHPYHVSLVSELFAAHTNYPVLFIVTIFLFQGGHLPQGGMMAVAQRQAQAFALAQGMQVKTVMLVAQTVRREDGFINPLCMYPCIKISLLSERAFNSSDGCNITAD